MRLRWIVLPLLALFGCDDTASVERSEDSIRIATYNTHLARGEAGKLVTELRDGSAQVDAVIRVIAEVNPDVLLSTNSTSTKTEKRWVFFKKGWLLPGLSTATASWLRSTRVGQLASI